MANQKIASTTLRLFARQGANKRKEVKKGPTFKKRGKDEHEERVGRGKRRKESKKVIGKQVKKER